MREIRLSGSEGGGAATLSLPLSQLASRSEGQFSRIVHELPGDDGQRQRQKEDRSGQ